MRHGQQKKWTKFWYRLTLSRVRSTPIFCPSSASFFDKGFLLKTEMKYTMIKIPVAQQDWEHPHTFG